MVLSLRVFYSDGATKLWPSITEGSGLPITQHLEPIRTPQLFRAKNSNSGRHVILVSPSLARERKADWLRTKASKWAMARTFIDELVGQLVFWAQSTTTDYIRAEGDFHKEIYSWKDQQGRDKTWRTEWENGELSGEFMEWDTVGSEITQKKTQEHNKIEWASSVG